MAFGITPSLGVDLANDGAISGATPGVALPYYTALNGVMSPQLGSSVMASDGFEYLLAQAGVAVASNVAVVLTRPAMTFAAGSGEFQSPTITGGVAAGATCWIQKIAS